VGIGYWAFEATRYWAFEITLALSGRQIHTNQSQLLIATAHSKDLPESKCHVRREGGLNQ
jgi:hypothetical protein